jgi:radical SAM superfamily enzyme YgiQ (UPF0313 family)
VGIKQVSQEFYFRQYVKRFLDKERSTVILKKGAPVRFALVYPNRYQVGMASLGFQTVYRILNQHSMVRCERAFLYDAPFGHDIRALESGQRLDQFDVIGFSLSFEKDIVHVFEILNNLPSPLLFQHRSDADPIILIGGVVSGLNPSPLLPFVDGLLVGEGEGMLFQIADVLSQYIQTKKSRKQILENLSKIGGVYIHGFSSTINRQIQSNLEAYPTYTPVITPLSHFSNMLVVEVARGCRRGCHFCAARHVYYPFRSHSVESILQTIRTHNQQTDKIGLEGAGLSDYKDLVKLCRQLIQEKYQVSFSSIRADCVTPELVEVFDQGNVRSFTIAPEAGTEKLRNRIGKGITDETLINTVRLLSRSKVQTLKLYYLIGCPGENETDIHEIIYLTKELSSIFRNQSKQKKIRVSINGFIPKPFTPFQWATMDSEKELNHKRKSIREALKREKGIVFVPKSAREEILQGALSLGDEKVGQALMDAVQNSISWKEAFKRNGIDMDALLFHERPEETKHPWDFISYPLSKTLLWKQYQHSQSAN